ncbi:MAG TPA: prephenate dehydratase domain-containing protein [Oculatellaceae cyanobacterium]
MSHIQIGSAIPAGAVLKPEQLKGGEGDNKRCIAFQGNVGSFSHRAAKHFAEKTFDKYDTTLIACRSFGEVFEIIESSKNFYGAIPLENTTMGSIDANYDLLWTQSAVIVNEVFVPVHHNLITTPNAVIENIREVYSHPAALEQCKRLFQKYPHMKPTNHWDTSASAILVKERQDPTIAAIASSKACEEQDLSILIPRVEDYEHNATRFGLITKAEYAARHIPTPYKVSFALELPNVPGTLATVLTNFARCGVNLTSCKSRPEPGKPWHYRFFVDIEVTNEEQHKKLYAYRKEFQYDVRLLGLYPIGASADVE